MFLKFHNIDLVDITPASETLFVPFGDRVFVPTKLVVKTRKITGAVTTPPQFKLTNSSADVLAAGANTTGTVGYPKVVAITPVVPVTKDLPLTLTKTVAAAGSTVYKVDLYVEGYLLP